MKAGDGVSRLSVLHVVDHSWPVLSGYSIRTRSILLAERDLGYTVRLLSGPAHQLDEPEASQVSFDGIVHLRTQLGHGLTYRIIQQRWPLLRELAVLAVLRRSILRVVDSGCYDLIHAHSPSLCGLAAWSAARRRQLPFVYEIRGFWEDSAVDHGKTTEGSLRYKSSRALETFVAKRADAVVGISENILAEMRARGLPPQKLVQVPNGVDSQRFAPVPRDETLANELRLGNEPVLGFIGSLWKFEGISWLIEGVAALRAAGSRFTLLVIGHGEEAAAIKNAISQLGAEQYVRFLGRIDHEHIPRYYSLIDVAVYPRRRVRLTERVTPLKPLEAMAMGKAVLASDVGGLAELIKDGETGLLFASEQIKNFVAQARRLLEQPQLRARLGMRARESILREKDWNVLVERYANLYNSLTGGYASRKGKTPRQSPILNSFVC